jgi:glycosyltransferase involved in cell wall biosynthesis
MGRSLKRADSVVAVSEWTGKLIRERYGTPYEKLSVIGNAVNPEEIPAAAEGIPHILEGPFLLSVGHLEVRKNLEVLIEAFALIRDEWDGVMVLVGRDQGSKDSIVEAAGRLGISDRVILKQGLSYPELARLYMDCSMVVCPSRYEGFGITLLEGISAGKPVIASGIPPHKEVAGEAALYCHPDSPDLFADAIRSVLNDSHLCRSLVLRGEERLELFSWDRSAVRLETLYRELLGG